MKQFNLEEYLANPSKKVVTRDGKSARIVCTDRVAQEYKLLALVMKDGTESVCVYNTDGCVYKNETHALDLFFASEKHEGWINLFKVNSTMTTGEIYNTEEEAKSAIAKSLVYISTVKIEWEE